jgi:hypothetical protein
LEHVTLEQETAALLAAVENQAQRINAAVRDPRSQSVKSRARQWFQHRVTIRRKPSYQSNGLNYQSA